MQRVRACVIVDIFVYSLSVDLLRVERLFECLCSGQS